MTTNHIQGRREIAATLLAAAGAVVVIGLGVAAPANASVSGASGSSESGQTQGQNQADEKPSQSIVKPSLSLPTNVAPSASVGPDTKIQVGK